ncbi:MAG: hypothetical protein SFX73_37925 [Kofleriaceae bacterium]|nr:hypothetical protein [Kofleriaceae bacterium]
MRVGDLLLQRGAVTLDDLARVLAEQHAAKMRICSLLVARGVVSFDDASRALGEHLGVAAVLRKHLQHRDPSVVSMLPAPLARRIVAVPIGKLGDGAVIVCVRDPSRANYGHIARAMPGRFVMAVGPSMFLEKLVERVYAPKVDVQIDIEVVRPRATPPPLPTEIPIEIDEPVLAPRATEADIDNLFDALIEKPAAPSSPALPVEVRRINTPSRPPTQRDSLDATIASFGDIDDAAWLFDVVLRYVAMRWQAALLFELRGDTAVAVRGHGATLITITLTQPSIVSIASGERRLVHERLDISNAVSDQVAKALGRAMHPVAAPVAREGSDVIKYVFAVGEPSRVDEDAEDAAFDLAVLAESMGDALERMG